MTNDEPEEYHKQKLLNASVGVVKMRNVKMKDKLVVKIGV